MKMILVALVVALAGCSTTIRHTTQECDTTVDKFIGLPYNSTSECSSSSESTGAGDITDPRPEEAPQ